MKPNYDPVYAFAWQTEGLTLVRYFGTEQKALNWGFRELRRQRGYGDFRPVDPKGRVRIFGAMAYTVFPFRYDGRAPEMIEHALTLFNGASDPLS